MDDAPTYTRETANELLPQVRERLQALQDALPEVQEMKAAAAGNGGGPGSGAWKKGYASFEEGLKWFENAGIIVKDVAQGLIDFPAIKDGEEVLLCWKDGEPSVDFWHYPDTGFAGRRPL